ncbi:MAG: hypothetical protein COW16_03285 [Sphingomonadales bacterium CG12_big_fil_rev_8_21_14_0_65_65_10]|jgi:hypothetical protein|uniref:Uncharacterized protein n=1 Tax=Blastomonas marina TaxID=1867408 RepID=A0ABQ1F9F4_9SPHN|nr:DUF5985 family protein [Blastomonas marina]PIW55938.1 MAG: hypothetical protein COW16_03285 [Sphingomonadales bacterium CG12_big_fil_rev_8_21_14_0_65_65_10]WPZ04631.1 DUF5985 family protein [Blastomonas marina]GGA03235.1 hypothetical protein GCM10010923_10100 [Blastomonas marina]
MIEQFLSGAVVMAFAIAGLLFLKYYRRTRQRLFVIFAASFFLLAVNYAWLALTQVPVEERSPLFLVRLLAFSLIIFAIVYSNRDKSAP